MSQVDGRFDAGEADDAGPAADAFALVGDEHRIGILAALWRLPEPASFSEIRQHVEMRDSARFNYHLGKLRGQFVRKSDAGYELRTAGERVVQAVLSGSFTGHPTREIAIDDPCTTCGETLRAEYDDEMLRIECPSCGHGHGEYPFPPGGLRERTDEEVLEAFDHRVRHLHCLAKDGVCPECNGRTETTIERGEECCLGTRIHAIHTCQQCATELCSAVGLGLLDHSTVVGFYAEHGIALSEMPYWRLDWCVDDAPVAVVDEDPWRLRIRIDVDEDTLVVTADERLDVVETTRT